MTEEQRRALVESGPIYLHNGLRATLGGWKDPIFCSVTSAQPGFWRIGWDALAAICERPDRRMIWLDSLWRGSAGWLGYTPRRADFHTDADYEAAKARGEAV